MPKTKYSYPFPEDWLEEIVKTIQQQKSQGLKPILSELLQSLLNSIMLKEGELFLKSHPENSSNGFYNRNLYLSFGNLNLKVPRVRFGNSFRPSILPPPWKRIDKDYEELLIAMLANGYSKAQIRALEVNIFIQFSNLQDRWWRKPMPTVRAVSYELQQKFTLTYEMEAVL